MVDPCFFTVPVCLGGAIAGYRLRQLRSPALKRASAIRMARQFSQLSTEMELLKGFGMSEFRVLGLLGDICFFQCE